MNANPTLAAALREAARRIEDGDAEYLWDAMAMCNCGILAQVVVGISADELYMRLHETGPDWWNGIWMDAEQGCPLTGLPAGTIRRALGDVGLTGRDLDELEHTSNPAVRAASGVHPYSTDARSAVRYMRAWADLIDVTPVIELKPPSRTAVGVGV